MFNESKCKKCRRAGQKLFLRADRCNSPKCAMVKRAYPPGMHGKAYGRRVSEYGQQLAEKQKIRFTYGISEEQFKKYVKQTLEKTGNKEQMLVDRLEKRLDNVVFRLGWAKSRGIARQIVTHGHILINNKTIDVPAYSVRQGDVLGIKEKCKKSPLFDHLQSKATKIIISVPAWLVLEKDRYSAKITGEPKMEDFGETAEISKVIEFYSR